METIDDLSKRNFSGGREDVEGLMEMADNWQIMMKQSHPQHGNS